MTKNYSVLVKDKDWEKNKKKIDDQQEVKRDVVRVIFIAEFLEVDFYPSSAFSQ